MAGVYPKEFKQQAAQLHAAGWGCRRIGKHLGVPRDRVRDWLNPERRRRLVAAQNERKKIPCLGCGRPKKAPLKGTAEELCKPCQSRRKQQRDAKIITLWATGAKIEDIAAELDTTFNTIRVEIGRIRTRPNGYELLPRRYKLRG